MNTLSLARHPVALAILSLCALSAHAPSFAQPTEPATPDSTSEFVPDTAALTLGQIKIGRAHV